MNTPKDVPTGPDQTEQSDHSSSDTPASVPPPEEVGFPNDQQMMEHGLFIDTRDGAWDLYNNPNGLGPGLSYSGYLSARDYEAVAKALGRPIKIDELRLLVMPDGEQVSCRACMKTGKTSVFQPVKWVWVNPQLLDALAKKGVFTGVTLQYRGHFFVAPQGYDAATCVIALCGRPLSFETKPVEGGKKQRFFFTNKATHLFNGFERNGHKWGFSSTHSASIMERRAEEARRDAEMARELDDFFGGKGGGQHNQSRREGRPQDKGRDHRRRDRD